jgi:hypothetical protein
LNFPTAGSMYEKIRFATRLSGDAVKFGSL